MSTSSEANKRLLLHTCCGPCSTYVARWFVDAGYDVTGYFYNPNIHPHDEYVKRLEASEHWARQAGIPMVVAEGYDLSRWVMSVGNDVKSRCRECYRLRLGEVAALAKSMGYDGFSTTLLISPYQKHEIIQQEGETAARQADTVFYYYDFRPHFKETYGLSREYELYRQNYCGCIFSDHERAVRVASKKRKAN